MRKWIILMMVLMMVPLVLAADICEEKIAPTKNCTMLTPSITCDTYNYTIYNASGSTIEEENLVLHNNSIYRFTFNYSKGSYIVSLCDGSTREMIVEGEDEMAGLAIAIFILVVAGSMFALSFTKKKYVNEEITNIIIRRSFLIIGIYLMMLNSAIMATIADNAGLDLTQEMFRYMWMFGWAGYVTMLIVALSTLFSVLKLWKIRKYNERYGDDDEY